jgi:ABC-type nitrate/sulfonate/bicarbonate transport system permease component
MTPLMRGRRLLPGVLGTTGCLLTWQLASALGGRGLVPAPDSVLQRMVTLGADPAFTTATAATVLAWLLTMTAAALVAVPTGIALGSWPLACRASQAIVEWLRPVPPIALLPLVTVLLGAGPATAIALGVVAGIWPLLLTVLAGVASIDPQLLAAARSCHANRWQVAWRVRLPAVLPALVTGLRVAAAAELVVLVSTEFLGGDPLGVGAYLNSAGDEAGDLTTVMAGVVIVGLLGVAMNRALTGLRRRWFDQLTTADSASTTSSSPRSRWAHRGLSVTVLAGGLLGWHLIAASLRSPFLPGPRTVLPAALRLCQHPATTVLPSLAHIAMGWSIAVTTGITGGVLVGRIPLLRDSLDPVLAWLRSVPPVLCLPALFVVLHIGAPLEIWTIASGSIWPILLATAEGVAAVHPTLLDTSRAYRTPWWRHVGGVLLPAAGPQILAGLRISLSLSLVLMVVSELVGATEGLGALLVQAQSQFDYPDMWAAVVLLGLLGYLGNHGLSALQHRILPTAGPSL